METQRNWQRGPAYWLGILLLFNALLVGMTVVTVRAQTPDVAALLAPGADCKDPCWLGIQPGVTRINSAMSLLRRAGINFKNSVIGVMGAVPVQAPGGWLDAYFYPGVNGFKADNTIVSICLKDHDEEGSLLLGEVLAALGPPDEVRLRRPELRTVRVLIRYHARQIELAVVLPRKGARIAPSTPIDMLCFLPMRMFSPTQQESSDLVLDWRGAASILRYYAGPPFGEPSAMR